MARRRIRSATDQRPFIMVYQDFLESDLLDNHYQKLVYIYLKKFADGNSQCFPSVKTLAKLTKIGTSKVKQTLAELEEKGVISREHRSREDGGKSSNLYTLYDVEEIWNVGGGSQNLETTREKISDAKMIAELRKRGYLVLKEKEPDETEPTKVTASSSTQLKQFDIDNNILNQDKSQELERYTLDDIREIYDYDVMLKDNPSLDREINSVMSILHTVLNTTRESIRIGGEDRPAMSVCGKLMRLEYPDILYAIEKFKAQSDRIKNPTAYMLTLLYNAKEQMNLDILNQIMNDGAI